MMRVELSPVIGPARVDVLATREGRPEASSVTRQTVTVSAGRVAVVTLYDEAEAEQLGFLPPRDTPICHERVDPTDQIGVLRAAMLRATRQAAQDVTETARRAHGYASRRFGDVRHGAYGVVELLKRWRGLP